MSLASHKAAKLIKPPQRVFEQKLLERIDLPHEDTGDGRFYVLPETGERFMSVTTKLGRLMPSDWLAEWKSRIGEQRAAHISGVAKSRGTALHTLAERYLLGDPEWATNIMPATRTLFYGTTGTNGIKGHLDKSLTTLYGIEVPLYSRRIKAGGRADLLGHWEGEPAVIDFKGSSYPKELSGIEGYFLQTAAYGIMTHELYGIAPKKLVVVIGVEHEDAQVFVQESREWVKRVHGMFVAK